jgi:Reverse transcriptase (RNA-dependent DNA polymerase)
MRVQEGGKEECLCFIKEREGQPTLWVLIYVDGIPVCSTDLNMVEGTKKVLGAHFAVKDLGDVSFFLGMHYSRVRRPNGVRFSINPSNERLTVELLKSFNMEGVYTETNSYGPYMVQMHDESAPSPTDNRFRELAGGLLYLENTVRPDISFAVGNSARHTAAPATHDWKAGMDVLKCLEGTKTFGRVWDPTKDGVVAFVHSDLGEVITARDLLGGMFSIWFCCSVMV